MKSYMLIIPMVLLISSCGGAPTAKSDLFVDAVQSRASADAMAQQAQLQEAFLTGTAQAPIVHITETAAGLVIQQTEESMMKTTVAESWTSTPSPTASITMTPTINVTGTLAVYQLEKEHQMIANDIERDNLSLEGARSVNQLWAISPYIVGLVALILAIMFGIAHAKRAAFVPVQVDERGKPMPVIDVVEGIAVDIDRAVNGVVQFKPRFLKELPAVTSERQDAVTARAQLVDMATRRAKLPKRLVDEQGQLTVDGGPLKALGDGNVEMPLVDLPLPEWNMWMSHWKPGKMALGVNGNGLMQSDPAKNPHWLFCGTTGSFKTRGGLRVLVACALASGWQVVIAGKQLDYRVFDGQPNAHLVPFSLLQNPEAAIALLRSVYGEIEQRDAMLNASGKSLWSQTGRVETLIVMDEFSNLSDALEDVDVSKKKELWRWARMDTAEARKYGIHMAYALQDPTAQSIDLRIRRNTTAVMFRVKDVVSSRTILNMGGAEALGERHFLASMARIEEGAAFAPSDEEIRAFLGSHVVRQGEPPKWLEEGRLTVDGGRLVDGSGKNEGESLTDWVEKLDDKGLKILELCQAGSSQRDIERSVFGYVGGSAANKVGEVIRKYRELKNATTTATTGENMPFLGVATA